MSTNDPDLTSQYITANTAAGGPGSSFGAWYPAYAPPGTVPAQFQGSSFVPFQWEKPPMPAPATPIDPMILQLLNALGDDIRRLLGMAENQGDSLEKKVEEVIKGVLDNKVAPSQVDDLKQAADKNVRDRSLRRAIRPI